SERFSMSKNKPGETGCPSGRRCQKRFFFALDKEYAWTAPIARNWLLPQKHPRRIFHPNRRFPPRTGSHRIRHQEMTLNNQKFFIADPTNQRRVWPKRQPPWRIIRRFNLNRRQIRQCFANALRLFRIRLTLLRQLHRLATLRRRGNGHRNLSRIRREPRIGRVEAHIVVSVLVSRLLVEDSERFGVLDHKRPIVALIRPS